MIRRDLLQPGEDGRRRWMLISQVDHAHLAAQLAEHWGREPFAPLTPHEPLLRAIFHHDDGWREWEGRPKLDPVSGKPLTFNEMPLDDSLSIWRKSIAAARRLGPFEGYVVAGHFRALLERFDSWRNAGDCQTRMADEFLAEFGRQMTIWLHDWQPGDLLSSTRQAAKLGLAQLQLFDALSLWLCSAVRTEPHSLGTPAGPVITLTPLDTRQIQVAPWPLTVKRLRLEVPGRAVEALHYASPEELTAARVEPGTVSWELVS